MSSSLKYILYLFALHLILGVLAWYAFADRPYLILGMEVLVLGSAYVAFRIYRSILSPVKLLHQGAAALEDQDFTVKLLPTGSREMDGIVTVYNRMIDQLREERVSGRQQEEFLDQILETAEMGVVVLDFDGEVSSMNAWMRAQCEVPDFRSLTFPEILHPRGGAKNGTREQGEANYIVNGAGSRRYHVERSSFVDQGFERGFLLVQDVTAELLQAEKEAYGKVIRMMAHEVNNTNTAVNGILRTLLDAAREGDAQLGEFTVDYLPSIITRTDNMTDFIRNFARVVRLPEPQRKRTDLNALVRRSGEVLTPQLAARNIRLDYDLPGNAPIVEADATQLEQVLINALTNARQSIGEGGRITLAVTERPTGFIVADDGPGIDPTHADQVFTPFFSTKPTGQGIGLTLTRDILENHGADYQLRTEADGWTRFRVTFRD